MKYGKHVFSILSVAVLLENILPVLSSGPISPEISILQTNNYVNLGATFSFLCTVKRPIEDCNFYFINQYKRIKIREKTETEEYSYLGRGFEKGECGISYWRVHADMEGNVTCTVGFPDLDVESIISTQLNINVPPSEIHLQPTKKKGFEFNENEEMTFKCTSKGATREPSNITLFLDDKEVSYNNDLESFLIYSKVANFEDHDKSLVCQVDHSALSLPLHVTRRLVVKFKPRLDKKIVLVTDGKDTQIIFEVAAHPLPSNISWQINGNHPESFNNHKVYTRVYSNARMRTTLIFSNTRENTLNASVIHVFAENMMGSLDQNFILNSTTTLKIHQNKDQETITICNTIILGTFLTSIIIASITAILMKSNVFKMYGRNSIK